MTISEEMAERFQLAEAPLFQLRHNIARTQPVAAVRSTPVGRQLSFLRLGLIPSWASDAAIGNKLLNARCETFGLCNMEALMRHLVNCICNQSRPSDPRRSSTRSRP
jgi:putative SOS response-associated peptidase YedK